MGVSLSTAQVLAPLSFAVDFGAQLYGMLQSQHETDPRSQHGGVQSVRKYDWIFHFPVTGTAVMVGTTIVDDSGE